jgi:hypothetical protein
MLVTSAFLLITLSVQCDEEHLGEQGNINTREYPFFINTTISRSVSKNARTDTACVFLLDSPKKLAKPHCTIPFQRTLRQKLEDPGLMSDLELHEKTSSIHRKWHSNKQRSLRRLRSSLRRRKSCTGLVIAGLLGKRRPGGFHKSEISVVLYENKMCSNKLKHNQKQYSSYKIRSFQLGTKCIDLACVKRKIKSNTPFMASGSI